MFDFLNNLMGPKKSKVSEFKRSAKITDDQCLVKIWEIERRAEEQDKLAAQICELVKQRNLIEKEAAVITAQLYRDLEKLYPGIWTINSANCKYMKVEDNYFFVSDDREEG